MYSKPAGLSTSDLIFPLSLSILEAGVSTYPELHRFLESSVRETPLEKLVSRPPQIPFPTIAATSEEIDKLTASDQCFASTAKDASSGKTIDAVKIPLGPGTMSGFGHISSLPMDGVLPQDFHGAGVLCLGSDNQYVLVGTIVRTNNRSTLEKIEWIWRNVSWIEKSL